MNIYAPNKKEAAIKDNGMLWQSQQRNHTVTTQKKKKKKAIVGKSNKATLFGITDEHSVMGVSCVYI